MRCFFSPVVFFSQEGINNGGGTGMGTGGIFSDSVGHPFVATTSNATGILQEGIQRQFTLTVTLATNEQVKELDLKVYPNPTSGQLNLRADLQKFKNLGYKIYSTEGKIIISGRVKNNETIIDMLHYPSAMYLLLVSEDARPVQTFKILKKITPMKTFKVILSSFLVCVSAILLRRLRSFLTIRRS